MATKGKIRFKWPTSQLSFQNFFNLKTNHLHHACSTVDINHEKPQTTLYSFIGPSQKTITQGKGNVRLPCTWSHGYDITLHGIYYIYVAPPPHKLNQAENIFFMLCKRLFWDWKYYKICYKHQIWHKAADKTMKSHQSLETSGPLLPGNHIFTAVQTAQTAQGPWHLNLHLLNWIPLQVIPARKHNQAMNKEQKLRTTLKSRRTFHPVFCVVCLIPSLKINNWPTFAYFSAACAISFGTHSCLPLVTERKKT